MHASRSGDNFVELVLSFHLCVNSGIELDLHDKHLYPLNHLTRP